MKLSYIVSVYNVEAYLDKCLRSLYNQSLELADFEVVIINDGSSDSSIEIIEKYRTLYQNITLIEQENQGLSVARNNGINHAKGDYILCVDSDDFLIQDSISNLLQKAIDLNLDVLRGEYRYCDDADNLLLLDDTKRHRYQYSYKIIDGDLLFQCIYCKEFYVPLLLIRRSLLLENRLYFREHVYFEDIEFAFKLSLLAKRVMYVPIVFYIYRLRDGSITRNLTDKKILDLFAAIKQLKSYSGMIIYPEKTNRVLEETITQLTVYLLISLSNFAIKDRKELLKQLDMKSIPSLLVFGNIKEVIVSALYNVLGTNVTGLLSPVVRLRNSLLK